MALSIYLSLQFHFIVVYQTGEVSVWVCFISIHQSVILDMSVCLNLKEVLHRIASNRNLKNTSTTSGKDRCSWAHRSLWMQQCGSQIHKQIKTSMLQTYMLVWSEGLIPLVVWKSRPLHKDMNWLDSQSWTRNRSFQDRKACKLIWQKELNLIVQFWVILVAVLSASLKLILKICQTIFN